MPKSTVELDSRVSQAPELIASILDRQTALLSITSGRYYGLDELGTQIWELIIEPQQVSAICERLVAEYRVERQLCERDTLAFLQALADSGLLRIHSG